MMVLLILLFGLMCWGGMKFLDLLTSFSRMMAESPETRERRQREEAVRNNIRFYEENYAGMLELLKDTWYVKGIKMTHGGVIRATYRKYPNVWMRIDLSYDEYLPNGKEFCLKPEFYIDRTHCAECSFGLILLTSDDEERRKESLESLNRLVDFTVKDWCENNGVDPEPGKFLFSFTDVRDGKWRKGSLDPEAVDPKTKVTYAYAVPADRYSPGCMADPESMDFKEMRTVSFPLDDKQRIILSTIQ